MPKTPRNADLNLKKFASASTDYIDVIIAVISLAAR
jgi:hypothetical protein